MLPARSRYSLVMKFNAHDSQRGTKMFNVDTTKRAGRMMNAGQVTITATSRKTGTHITMRAKALAKSEETGKWYVAPINGAAFVTFEVPNPDGWADKVARYSRKKGFVVEKNADPARAWVAQKMIDFLASGISPANCEIVEESRCGRCGRQLTDPVSIERGIGPECYGRETGSKHQVKRGDVRRDEMNRSSVFASFSPETRETIAKNADVEIEREQEDATRAQDIGRAYAEHIAQKNEFARREREQEAQAFLNDPDMRDAQGTIFTDDREYAVREYQRLGHESNVVYDPTGAR